MSMEARVERVFDSWPTRYSVDVVDTPADGDADSPPSRVASTCTSTRRGAVRWARKAMARERRRRAGADRFTVHDPEDAP